MTSHIYIYAYHITSSSVDHYNLDQNPRTCHLYGGSMHKNLMPLLDDTREDLVYFKTTTYNIHRTNNNNFDFSSIQTSRFQSLITDIGFQQLIHVYAYIENNAIIPFIVSLLSVIITSQSLFTGVIQTVHHYCVVNYPQQIVRKVCR